MKSHGMSSDRIYKIWAAMFDRCENPKSRKFKNYGGRGINVCERWRGSFLNFLADMGPTYVGNLQLDRRDNNGNYEPGNCRWATSKEQQRNRRNNFIIPTPKGPMPVGAAAEVFNIPETSIWSRMSRGWPPEKWLNPPRKYGATP